MKWLLVKMEHFYTGSRSIYCRMRKSISLVKRAATIDMRKMDLITTANQQQKNRYRI